jgi:DHA1 family bicyclomycin/chloramphenicol resistance-like MFS transporter
VGVAILAACLVIFKEALLVQQRTPLATSLALKGYPDVAGTASSLLGLARFAFGGIAAPLVGIGGAENALPFGVVTVVSVAAAVACLGLVRTPGEAR